MAEPDRTIDAQIAVMLEPNPSEPNPDEWRHKSRLPQSPLGFWFWHWAEGDELLHRAPMQFSTDLNASMRAYQEFQKCAGCQMYLYEFNRGLGGPELWSCVIWKILNIQAAASTPAMAICLALLEAAKR